MLKIPVSQLKSAGNDISKLFKSVDSVKELLKDIDECTFSVLEFSRHLERKNVLMYLSTHLFARHHCFDILNHEPFVHFIRKVRDGYDESNPYHNDIHGVDVMQGAHMFLIKGKLARVAQLDHLDEFSFLFAALMHDFKHNGFTNAFHQNSMSPLAIRYNDMSVQENFHVAETVELLESPDTKILSGLS